MIILLIINILLIQLITILLIYFLTISDETYFKEIYR